MLELNNHKHAFYGIQGSGKTVLAKSLMKGFRKPAVYRVNADFDNENVYLYKPVDKFKELDMFVKWFIKSDCDLLILDEADLFIGSGVFALNKYPNLNDLMINHRHYGKAIFLISRRPQDIPTKIVESCRYSFWFKLEGANIFRKMREIDQRLTPLMEQINFQDFKFIIKPIGEQPYIHEKVAI